MAEAIRFARSETKADLQVHVHHDDQTIVLACAGSGDTYLELRLSRTEAGALSLELRDAIRAASRAFFHATQDP